MYLCPKFLNFSVLFFQTQITNFWELLLYYRKSLNSFNIKNKKQYEWRLFGEDEWVFTTEWRYTYNNKRHRVTQELHETKRDTLKHTATFRYEYIYDNQGNYLQSKSFLRLIRTGKEVLSEIEKLEITYY